MEPQVAVFCFGLVFVVTLLVLAIKFPRPTEFQYVVFRSVLALAAAGIAVFIPGLLEVDVSGIVKAGGALAVFVVIYFFSPAGIVRQQANLRVSELVDAWRGVRAPDTTYIDAEMAHRALNAMRIVADLWRDGEPSDRQLICQESWAPYRQWFEAIASTDIEFSDSRSGEEHIEGLLTSTYNEMRENA